MAAVRHLEFFGRVLGQCRICQNVNRFNPARGQLTLTKYKYEHYC